MSFLGAIGHLMNASGLQPMLETIYAGQTVPHMLSGKAISRSIRGHLIVSGVIHAIIVSHVYNCPLLLDENNNLRDGLPEIFDVDEDSPLHDLSNLHDSVLNNQMTVEGVLDECITEEMHKKFTDFQQELSESRTAKLWIQYLDMVGIILEFIKAERTANFNLHLKSLFDMLPYLAASGHHLYTKSAYIYLQTMYKLEDTHPSVFSKFQQGYHVVRRSERFWGGLSTDLVIEQVGYKY